MSARLPRRQVILVLASTYPRWRDDHEPRFVHELCKRLSRQYEVHALVPDAAEDAATEIDGIIIHRYRYALKSRQTLVYGGGMAANVRNAPWKLLMLPGFLVCQLLAACRIARQHRVAAVHAHWLIPQGMVAWVIKRLIGVPYLVTSHGGDLFGLKGRVANAIKRMVGNDASLMTVVSKAMHEEAVRLGVRSDHIHVVPMGVDLASRFAVAPIESRVPARLLFVGRLVAKKGLSYLIDAMPEVLRQVPEAELHIVGFGPLEQSLKEQTIALGLGESVRFLGPKTQEELPAMYGAASLFVAPFVRDRSGDQEGLPVALMEAIGCGCPILVGRVPGLGDLLGPLEDEVTVDPEDTPGLASRITHSLVNVAAAAALSSAIRDRVAVKLDWVRIGEQYSDLLRQVICCGSAGED